jgi:hypothetical protein
VEDRRRADLPPPLGDGEWEDEQDNTNVDPIRPPSNHGSNPPNSETPEPTGTEIMLAIQALRQEIDGLKRMRVRALQK